MLQKVYIQVQILIECYSILKSSGQDIFLTTLALIQ